MLTYQVQSIIDGQPTFKKPLAEILAELKAGGALKTLSPLEYHTDRQRRWWKGILLPALAKDTGDSIGYWETKLKLAVLPNDFVPFYVPIGKQVMPIIPSITILSKKKMKLLIEGSVDHLRDERIYKDQFLWVTLPDSELRKNKVEPARKGIE